jgi:hypothetical protein
MHEGIRVVGFRRLEDRRGISRLLNGRRLYEVVMSDDTTRLVSFSELDKMLDARHFPADFWACVHAADYERDHLGDNENPRMTAWPTPWPPA